MQISMTNSSDTHAKLHVVAAQDELIVLKNTLLGRFQGQVKVPGFRPGHAPLAMVEKSLDQAMLQQEFLSEAINQMYVQAATEKRLRTVGNPQVDVTKFVPFSTLEFTAEVDVIGEVKLPDYTKIKVSKTAVTVTAADVTEVIRSLQARAAERKDVNRAAQKGDEAYIDFKGVDAKGEPVNGAEAKDYALQLGSNSFIPGFEDNVVGMKANEEKTFTLPFPKDYGVKALAGKKVTFTVSLTKVQELIEPKLDDDFASKVGPFKTLADLKADIKTELTAQKERETQAKFESDLVEAIASKTKVALPESVVDGQLDRLEDEEKRNLLYRGQTWDEHLAEEGVTATEHRTQKRPQAEMQVRASLALAEIAEREQIDVQPEELEAKMQQLKSQYNDKQMQTELAKPDARRDVVSRMLTEKTIDRLVELVGK